MFKTLGPHETIKECLMIHMKQFKNFSSNKNNDIPLQWLSSIKENLLDQNQQSTQNLKVSVQTEQASLEIFFEFSIRTLIKSELLAVRFKFIWIDRQAI